MVVYYKGDVCVNNIVIFNLRVANELISKGYKVVKVGVNNTDTSKVVVIFERTGQLISELESEYGILIK